MIADNGREVFTFSCTKLFILRYTVHTQSLVLTDTHVLTLMYIIEEEKQIVFIKSVYR